MTLTFSRFSRRFCAAPERGKIAETIGGEGRRCDGKREKAAEALSYALISTQELRKIGKRFAKRREPYRERRREPAKIGGTMATTLA